MCQALDHKTWITLINPHNNFAIETLSFPFYRYKNWELEKPSFHVIKSTMGAWEIEFSLF